MIAIGESQSAAFLVTYANAIRSSVATTRSPARRSTPDPSSMMFSMPRSRRSSIGFSRAMDANPRDGERDERVFCSDA
jgi:hypothetical protein